MSTVNQVSTEPRLPLTASEPARGSHPIHLLTQGQAGEAVRSGERLGPKQPQQSTEVNPDQAMASSNRTGYTSRDFLLRP